MEAAQMSAAIDSEIEEMELEISKAQEMKELGEAARRLIDNTDFNKLVMETFFKEEVIRLGHLVSSPNLTPDQRDNVRRDLEGVGVFQRFLNGIEILGNTAAQALEEYQEELAEARASQVTIAAGGDAEEWEG
jgi:hypothetical protein